MRHTELLLRFLPVVLCSFLAAPPAQAATSAPASQPAGKTGSAFYPPQVVARARANAARYRWAADMRDRMVAAAQPWMKMSDEQLWELMFGNTIKRSWMVWSDGYCPACRKPVPMYSWEIDARARPWKVRCPHCQQLFPKNDFQAFYRSGLDESGIFQPARANRALLFNAEHPDPKDALHAFGVDDGEGYLQDGHRWRFIGAYLVYGQWQQAILDGIRKLSAAYVVTGDTPYAHKAAILLDRVADLYPTFDFRTQGVTFEGRPRAGYITNWTDACMEVRDLAVAYDQIFDAIAGDDELVRFLAGKSRQAHLANLKMNAADVRHNIETRVLRDTLEHRIKIESNAPQTDITMTVLETVLGWPANRDEVMRQIDAMLQKTTVVDGMSGEKGIDSYATIAPSSIADFVGRYSRIEPRFLERLLKADPRIRDLYRFHIDTWCLERFYPREGDSSNIARPPLRYMGLPFTTTPGLGPSSYQFLWDLYTQTGDADYLRILERVVGKDISGLPFDLFAPDPSGFEQQYVQSLRRTALELRLPSINKQQWHIAILRAGEGPNQCAAWLDYDNTGEHGHLDGLNLGLFALGLDLLPDFGYPPVDFGGWDAPKATWYASTAAHNTVVVDGKNQSPGNGKTTLWAEGRDFRVIRASAPAMIGGQQYERTIAMVGGSRDDAYILDTFRVVGGSEHVKFLHGSFGEVKTRGLSLEAARDFTQRTQMRNFRRDAHPQAGWSADFTIEDRVKILKRPAPVHLRCVELTDDAEAYTAESWVSLGLFKTREEAWLPTLAVRRQGPAPLASTFVSLIEPYERYPDIQSARRLPLEGGGPGDVAIEVQLGGGRRDVIVARDVEHPLTSRPAAASLVQKDLRIDFDGDLCWVRFDSAGIPIRVAACRTRSLKAGDLELELAPAEFVEIALGRNPAVVSGDSAAIKRLRYKGADVRLKR